MKLFKVSDYLNEFSKLLYETKDIDKTKSLNKKINNNVQKVVTKKETEEIWKANDIDKSNFIDNIIKLLSYIATLPAEEIEKVYNVNNLKTIYYLIHNSNNEMNQLVNYFGQTGVKISEKNNLFKQLKYEIFYNNGQWISELYNFYKEKNERGIDINDIIMAAVSNENILKNFTSWIADKTKLPIECIKKLAIIKGEKQINRGAYELLLSIVLKGGTMNNIDDVTVNSETGKGRGGKFNLEIKVIDKGTPRIGNIENFNNIETISNNIRNILVSLIEKYNKKAGKNIIDINQTLTSKQFNIDASKNAGVPTVDTMIINIIKLILEAGESQNIKINEDMLKKDAINAYIRCMQSITKGNINENIRDIIEKFISLRSLNSFIEDNQFISPDLYYNFKQLYCAQFLLTHLYDKNFNYLFLIDNNKDILLVIDDNAIQNISNSPDSIPKFLVFEKMPQTYGKPGSFGLLPAIKIK